ncbi:Na+/melibiose symporter [Lentibacter algarum]|uniref:Na+/melibiose symporter n=2 Tax=Lentibacter TaxID=1434014 RepID=A0A1H3M9T9_9RHOB|nr:MFS transporter [Lentibacter algarum]SDY73044.1 Na+/melibiose symporter [Lentibacter algarum]
MSRRTNAQVSLFALMLAAAGLPLYIHLPAYASGELGMSLGALGGLLIGLRVLDFVQDPLLGRMVDRFPNTRALFAALALLGLGLGFALLFTFLPTAGQLFWLILGLALLFTAHSLGSILFYGQSTALAGGEAGLVKLAAYREGGSLVGVLLAALAPTLFVAAGAGGGGYPAFGLGLAAMAGAVWLLTRRLWQITGPATSPMQLSALKSVGGVHLLWIALINSLPVALTSTLFLFFVQDKLGLDALAGPLLMLFFLAAALSVPLWSALVRRHGARRILPLAMTLAIVSFMGAALLPEGAALAFALICLASGAALGADMVILPVLFSTALARAGLSAGAAFGLWSFAGKLSLALAAALALPALQLAGYTPNAVNTPQALTTLTLAYAVIPCIIKIAAIILVARLPQEVNTP